MILMVPDAPYVATEAEKVAIDRNQSAVLVCLAHSYPDAEFEWYNGSSLLQPGGRIDIEDGSIPGEEYPQQSLLIIDDIRNADFGEYTCVARNTMGSDQAIILLTVKGGALSEGIFCCIGSRSFRLACKQDVSLSTLEIASQSLQFTREVAESVYLYYCVPVKPCNEISPINWIPSAVPKTHKRIWNICSVLYTH